jgi:N utilization substance protein A
MEVIVADDQLSLAIGKKGQNVRLASKLTGWKIDIKSESKMEKISGEIFEMFKQLPYVGDVTSRILYNEGFRSMKEISEVDPEELVRILEIEKEKALEIVRRASEGTVKGVPEPTSEEVSAPAGPARDSVDRIEGVGEKTADILKANGFQTVQDLLGSDVEKLSSLPGIGPKKAEKLLQSAQRFIAADKE